MSHLLNASLGIKHTSLVQSLFLTDTNPSSHIKRCTYIFHGATAPTGQGPPHYRGFTNTDTPHSVGHLWTRDQPDAKTSTWQHTTSATERHPYPQLDSNPQFRKASCRKPTPRPRGHWDRPFRYLLANHTTNTGLCVCVCMYIYIYKCGVRRWLYVTRNTYMWFCFYWTNLSSTTLSLLLYQRRHKCMQFRSYATFSLLKTRPFWSAGNPQGRHGQTTDNWHKSTFTGRCPPSHGLHKFKTQDGKLCFITTISSH